MSSQGLMVWSVSDAQPYKHREGLGRPEGGKKTLSWERGTAPVPSYETVHPNEMVGMWILKGIIQPWHISLRVGGDMDSEEGYDGDEVKEVTVGL